MLSVDRYEELMDLIDELKIEIVAAERLGNLKLDESISHADMLKNFESTH